MLSTMRSSWLYFALLALVALSSALSIEEALHIDGIGAYLHHGVKRQASGTGSTTPSDEPESTPTPTPTSNTPSSTPAPPTSNTPTPTPSEDPTTDPTTAPTTEPSTTPTTGATTQRPPASTPPRTSVTPTDRTTSAPPTSRPTTPITRTSSFTSTSVQAVTITTRTISNGQQIDITSVSSSTSIITGASEVTELPSPQDSGSSSSSGLSESNKKIIGGVVGGVGGAILLGGIALVCWRIWGRKKRVAEDDDDIMAGTGAALGDKPQNGSSPFQSNLEQYHNPGGRPNAAANF